MGGKITVAAVALLALCHMVWGGGMVAMKFALLSFDPLQIMAVRVGVPALFYLCLWRQWRGVKVEKGGWKFLALMSLCEPCLFFFCITNAVRYTSASEAGVITAALPLFTALGAWLFLREKIGKLEMAAMLAAVIGIIGINIYAAGNEKAAMPLLGNFLVLLGMIFSAGYTLCARYLAGKYPGILLSAAQAFIGCAVFWPLCLFREFPDTIAPGAIAGLCYLGFAIGIGVYFTYNWAMRYVPATLAGIMANITPVFTLALAFLLLDEKFLPVQLGFMFLTIVAIAVAGAATARRVK